MRVYCYMRVGTKEQLEETPTRKEPVQKSKQAKKKNKEEISKKGGSIEGAVFYLKEA